MREDELGIVIIVTHVDDNLTIGSKEAIEKVLEEVKQHGFSLTVEWSLSDYLSCDIAVSKDGTKAHVGQPHMIRKLNSMFGEETKSLKKYRTPGTPGHRLVKATTEEQKVDEEKHSRHRTGAGMLLYLIKHSRQSNTQDLIWPMQSEN